MPMGLSAGQSLGLVFVVAWFGVLGFFDYDMVRDIQRQAATETYPTVPGRVIKNAGVRRKIWGLEARRRGFLIQYEYAINGKTYHSMNVRFAMSGGALRIVQTYPLGSQVTVHYNPRNYPEAILEPGVHGADLLLPLSSLPFNFLLLWVLIGVVCDGSRRKTEVGGARIITRGLVKAVRLPRWSPIVIALSAGIPALVLSIMGVSAFSGYDPSIRAVIVAWIISVTMPTIAWIIARLCVVGGRYDLVIDPVRHTLTLPMTFGRRTPIEVAAASVQDVHIEEVVWPLNRYGNMGRKRRYELSLAYRGPHGHAERAMLAKWWGDRQPAQALAAWIIYQAKLKVPLTQGDRTS